jgi:hydroxymethylbilane synthase
MQDGNIRLRGLVALPDGSRVAAAELSGSADDPEALGLRLVEQLRTAGADAILAELPGNATPA